MNRTFNLDRPGKRLPPLTALRTFEVAARHQQLKSAADELSVTPSAVSRQIRNLEDHLGITLFKRDKRAIELTELGQIYALDLKRIFDDLANATHKIRQQDKPHVIHVCTSMMSFAQRWLMPRLFKFQEVSPQLEIRLTTSQDIGPENFDSSSLDVGLTRHRSAREDLVSEHLMAEQLVIVCSPEAQAKKPVHNTEDLLQHRLITSASRPEVWSVYMAALGSTLSKPERETVVAHFFLAIEAVINGSGIAVMPLLLVESDLRSGRLIAPLNCVVSSGEEIYAVRRRRAQNNEAVANFISWLQEQAENTGKELSLDLQPENWSG